MVVNVMWKLKCRYTRAKLPAFVNRELPARTRTHVAQHIDECEDCYRAYVHQRHLAREVMQGLPTFGTPTEPALDRMWTNIEQEMARPAAASWPPRRLSLGYGLAVLALALLLMLPATMNGVYAQTWTPASIPAPVVPEQHPVTPGHPEEVMPTAIALALETAPGQPETHAARQTPEPLLFGHRAPGQE